MIDTGYEYGEGYGAGSGRGRGSGYGHGDADGIAQEVQGDDFCWFYNRPDAKQRAFAVAKLLNDMELEMASEDD